MPRRLHLCTAHIKLQRDVLPRRLLGTSQIDDRPDQTTRPDDNDNTQAVGIQSHDPDTASLTGGLRPKLGPGRGSAAPLLRGTSMRRSHAIKPCRLPPPGLSLPGVSPSDPHLKSSINHHPPIHLSLASGYLGHLGHLSRETSQAPVPCLSAFLPCVLESCQGPID